MNYQYSASVKLDMSHTSVAECHMFYYVCVMSAACGCDVAGTVGANQTCVPDATGQCSCKPNVEGRTCDTCKDGFYGLAANDSNGMFPHIPLLPFPVLVGSLILWQYVCPLLINNVDVYLETLQLDSVRTSFIANISRIFQLSGKYT